jgi:hypothetical protein
MILPRRVKQWDSVAAISWRKMMILLVHHPVLVDDDDGLSAVSNFQHGVPVTTTMMTEFLDTFDASLEAVLFLLLPSFSFTFRRFAKLWWVDRDKTSVNGVEWMNIEAMIHDVTIKYEWPRTKGKR